MFVWPPSCWDMQVRFPQHPDCLSLETVVCCHLQVYAMGRSESHTECGMLVRVIRFDINSLQCRIYIHDVRTTLKMPKVKWQE